MLKKDIKWLEEPEDHDYPAALSYLTLIMAEDESYEAVEKLKAAPMASFKAKDIFRASKLSLLGISNSHVEKNLDKVHNKKPLSPLLLVRDNGKLVIADGYHRVCAIYQLDEDALVPCKII